MPRVVYSAAAVTNLERLIDHAHRSDPDLAVEASSRIRSAMEILREHPFIGRIVTADIRELVISYGRTGYVALYRVDLSRDQVRVLAVRYQRELGYPR